MGHPTESEARGGLAGFPGKWPNGESGKYPFVVSALIVFLAAASLRSISMFNDLWLDEIWSWNLARLVSSPVEIITRLTHDNNHPLNTFFIWALGDRHSWEWYRLLSLVTGVASVGVMGVIARRYGRTESLTALALGGLNYFLIDYSSEARGYAPAAFFALAGFLLSEEPTVGKRRVHLVLFWLTVLLGLLSHSTYLFAYSGMLAWSALRLVNRGDPAGKIVAEMLKTHGLPLLFAAADILWLHTLTIGGGPEYSVWSVIPETALFAFGLPEYPALAVFACAAATALLLWEARALRAEASDQWIFFPVAILVAPALILVAAKPAVLFPRYFLVCMPFLLLLLARWMSRWARRGTPGKIVLVSLLVLYCSVNLLRFTDLARYGRGRYSAALGSIARQTAGDAIGIGSDNDFRNGMIVDFYSRYLPPGKKVVYVPGTGVRPEAAPEWVIVHRLAADPPSPPPPRFLLPNGSGYVLNGVFPSSAPSGFWWFLYRKAH